MKGIRYHKKKASIMRLVKSVGRMIPDAVDTLVYCYLGMAPITIPITAIFLAGAVEKILQTIL